VVEEGGDDDPEVHPDERREDLAQAAHEGDQDDAAEEEHDEDIERVHPRKPPWTGYTIPPLF
jgi:hypothetical protein